MIRTRKGYKVMAKEDCEKWLRSHITVVGSPLLVSKHMAKVFITMGVSTDLYIEKAEMKAPK